MTWDINFDEPRRLVIVTVHGALETAPLRRMTEAIRDAIRDHGSHGVLLDYTQTISCLEPYEIFERPRVLKELGFPAEVRVAVLYAALDENTQFLENVYRNQNYPVHVFADRDRAISWLQS